MSERTYSKPQDELPSTDVEHNPDLNAVHTQSGGLHSLLAVLYEASNDLDFSPDGPAFDAACRLSNLLILARDEAERLDTAIGYCIAGGRHAAATPSVVAPIIVDPTKLSEDHVQSREGGAVMITIPYPGQSPDMEMLEVFSKLRLLQAAAAADQQGAMELKSCDVDIIVNDVIGILEPIAALLSDTDGLQEKFEACRRAWYAEKGGAE